VSVFTDAVCGHTPVSTHPNVDQIFVTAVAFQQTELGTTHDTPTPPERRVV